MYSHLFSLEDNKLTKILDTLHAFNLNVEHTAISPKFTFFSVQCFKKNTHGRKGYYIANLSEFIKQ